MNNLKIFSYGGSNVTFKTEEGATYINATEMAKPFNERPNDFLNLKSTQKLIKAITIKNGNDTNQLVITERGGVNSCTWLHENIALDFAQWLSIDFKLWCNDRIKEILTNGFTTIQPTFQIPTTLSSALLLASQQAEQIEQQQLLLTEQTKQIEEKEKQVYQSQLVNKKLQTTITDQAPKVVFAEAIVSAETDVQIGQLAKIISQATGRSFGQNKLFAILRDNGYLLSRSEQYNLPAQTYVEKGIFKIKYSTYSDKTNSKTRINAITMVTPLGQEYFVNKFVRKFKA